MGPDKSPRKLWPLETGENKEAKINNVSTQEGMIYCIAHLRKFQVQTPERGYHCNQTCVAPTVALLHSRCRLPTSLRYCFLMRCVTYSEKAPPPGVLDTQYSSKSQHDQELTCRNENCSKNHI